MKPFIQIALSSGHVYELTSEVIAHNRAAAMMALHPSEFATLHSALADTRELFDDTSEIREWALNNMNPEDYMPTARLVRFTPPDQNFNAAEWSYHDHNAMIGELDGLEIMRQPVEAVMVAMAASKQLCNITVLNDDSGQAFGAAVMIIGSPNIVNSFITALQFTSDQLTGLSGLGHDAPEQTH